MAKSIAEFKEVYLSEFNAGKERGAIFPGVDFPAVIKKLEERNVKHVKITFQEIKEWDKAPMRKYFHGVVIKAFEVKLNECYSSNVYSYFSAKMIKEYLKAKFLGFVEDEVYMKFKDTFRPELYVKNFSLFIAFCDVNDSLVKPMSTISTTSLTPAEYWNFINKCEALYFELFNDMYDIREKPIVS